jgi:diguanylate cyclase (GGDEF)-like protein
VVVDRVDLGFVDILPCEGCLDHPLLGLREGLFWRRRVAAEAEPSRSAVPVVDPAVMVRVATAFEVYRNGKRPALEEIESVIDTIGRTPEGTAWNCGACGYGTCNEFAVAFLRGRASLRQCPPHQEWRAEDAQRQAAVDELTGLATFRVLRDRLTEEIARSDRSKEPFAVVFVDLDRFKSVNDVFGHEAGNVVLGAVGHGLKSAVRLTDVAARYGGDEFVVVLVRTDLDGARRVGEVLRQTVEAVGRDKGYEHGVITASIGVAAYDPAAGAPLDILDVADRELYRAKEAGGDRVVAVGDGIRESEG